MYKISTDHWTGMLEHWKEFETPSDAIKMIAYMRMAYPGSTTILIDPDGFLMDTKGLAELAHFIITS